MPGLAVQLHWHRASPVLQTGAYSSEHVVQYNNPHKVTADPATDWGETRADTNPEQALASAL